MSYVVLPKPHPKPIVVEVFISWLFKGKGRIVASCVAHPGNHHLPKGWVDVEKERSGEDFFEDICHTPKHIQLSVSVLYIEKYTGHIYFR